MDGRQGRTKVYVPHHAEWNGTGYGGNRVDTNLPVHRSDGGVRSVRLAHDPGSVPGRRIWRRHHLCRGACAGRQARLLHRLATDLTDSRHRGVTGRDRPDTDLVRQSGLRRMGLARSVPGVIPAGGHRDLHSAPAPGDAYLPGDQGARANDDESVEGGLPQLQHQIHRDRDRGPDRTGRGLVQRPVLGRCTSCSRSPRWMR
ncbi:hypothetical protein ACVW0I_004549 [Bradyrhizobium sp. LM6.11]